jgi:large subunit ribosomal protein L33
MPRDLVILACTECKRHNYTSSRNKRIKTERLEVMKFCPFDRKHTMHREVK